MPLTGFAPSITFLENAVNAAPQLLDSDVTFTSATSLSGGRLVVSGLLAEDRVTVLNQGSGAGEIGVSGADISFGGTVFGTLAGGSGNDAVITFNASATAAGVDALIQRLAYGNVSDTPTASRTLSLNVIDGAGVGLGAGIGTLAAFSGTANPFDGIDVGSFSAPAFLDLDGDGDLDLVAGERYGTLLAWRNTGTASAPVFTALTGTANPFNSIDVSYSSAPAFLDLDGDGDLDLVSGEFYGTLLAWRNTGPASAPVFTALTGTANPFSGIDVGSQSKPTFLDLDGDGDRDLVSGAVDGVLRAWRNTGTASAPVFTALTGSDNPFNGIDVGDFSAPAFLDLDGDGDLDLVAGERYGTLLAWRNTGPASAPVFTALSGTANPFNGIDVGYTSAPAFLDLDGDGDLDLVSGEQNGTLLAFRNTSLLPGITVTVAAEPDPATLNGFGPTATFLENTVNAAPQLLDSDVVFTAPGGVANGRLVVSGLLAEDRVSVLNQGSGAGQIGVSGASISFAGTVFGTLAGGAGNDAVITFNASATAVGVDALIQRLAYGNVSDTPTASRTLTVDVVDGAGVGLGLGIGTVAQLFDGANPFNSIDVVFTSTPAFLDLDGDGDLDLVSGERDGTLLAWRNTGPASAPVFTALSGTANPFNSIDVGDASAPAFVDLDGDGDLDIVSGEFRGTLLAFRNTGTASAPVFTALSGTANPFNSIDVGSFSTPAFLDLDSDGDLDLVLGNFNGTLQAWRNTGPASAPVFTALSGSDNPFDGINTVNYSAPAFVDLDGDGDLDLVSGERNGTLLAWRNTGPASAPVFTALSDTANPFNGIDVGYTSTPAFLDLDGDGDSDLVAGENAGTLLAFRNASLLPSITVTVTPERDPAALTGFGPTASFLENTVNAAPQLLDSDVLFTAPDGVANGRLVVSGLLAEDRVSVLNQGSGAGQIGVSGASISFGGTVIGTLAGGSGNDVVITFNASATAAGVDALIQRLAYGNVSDAPTLTRTLTVNVLDGSGAGLGRGIGTLAQLSGTANPFDGIDVGFGSAPALLDLDGDGDLDLVSGESGGTVLAWRNTGPASAPVFTALSGTDNPFNGIDAGGYSTPAFLDLDGDGDLDLVSGEINGTLLAWRNTGPASAPVFTALSGTDNPFNGINVGSFGTPAFLDLDGDGDRDLVSGESTGTLLAFRNTGTASAPVFTALSGTANPFNGIDVGTYSTPAFVDLDGDGDLDLVSGANSGTLLAWRNTGPASAPVFTALSGTDNPLNGIDVGFFSAPAFVDLDGDGDRDLVSGESNGALLAFRSTVPLPRITVTVTAETDTTDGGAGNDLLTGTVGDDQLRGFDGDDTIEGGAGNDTMDGGAGNDTLSYASATAAITVSLALTTAQNTGGAGIDTVSNFENLIGGAGNDSLTGNAGNNFIDGRAGTDTAIFSGTQAQSRIGVRDGTVIVSGADGVDTLTQIEELKFGAAAAVSIGSLGVVDELALVLTGGVSSYVLPDIYSGPVPTLQYQVLGTNAGDVGIGTSRNDFFNLFGSDDALDAGAGNDVLDGGTGSNFLTGGAGIDTFFLDGRGGTTTWSTITDWQAGEQLSVFGWKPGISTVLWVASAGAVGYEGVTMFGDLDGNGSFDTSVTWTGRTQADLPVPFQFADPALLWFVG